VKAEALGKDIEVAAEKAAKSTNETLVNELFLLSVLFVLGDKPHCTIYCCAC
jgi:hypothetical protein